MAYKRVYVYWVLIILTLLNVINHWERYLPSYLSHTEIQECISPCLRVKYQPSCMDCDSEDTSCQECNTCRIGNSIREVSMRDDICLDNDHYYVITGYSFTLPYCITVMVAGWSVDRFRHLVVEILVGAEILMSLVSALQAAASTFLQLCMARSAMGACLSFATPCVITIIAEIFPRDQRSYANGIYCFGTYMGYAFAALSVLFTLLIGWRSTVLCVAIFAMIVIFALGVSVKNPEMPHVPASVKLSLGDMKKRFANLLSSKLYYVLVAATSVREMGRLMLMDCFHSYTKQRYNSKYTVDSVFNALACSVAALISCYFGGRFGSIYSKKLPTALALIPAAGCFTALAPMCGALFAPSLYISYTCLWFVYLLGECWMGPSFAILQNFLPNDTVGIASAIMMLVKTLLGTVATDFIDSFNDAYVGESNTNLRSTLTFSLIVTYAGSGTLFFYLAKIMDGHKCQSSRAPDSDDDETRSLLPRREYNQSQGVVGSTGRQRS